MKHDPYLIPGWPCWLWNDKNKFLIVGLFWEYDRQGTPMFVESYRNGKLDETNIFQTYKHYRPIGTEWDFIKNHPEQEKFICSTVDQDGKLSIWDTMKVIGVYPLDNSIGVWRAYAHLGSNWTAINCGYCPDKTRYEKGAWKTSMSMRMRPVWAGGEG